MAAGSTHLLGPGRRKGVGFGAVAAVVVGALAIAAVLVGAPGATVAVAIVVIGGVAALWYTALTN